MNAPTENTALAQRKQFDLSPQNFEQAITFSNYLADSDLVPKDFKGKPGNCLIAMQWGAEVGLKPLQALQNLAVINGRPALWGDAVIAIVRNSPVCEYVIEEDNGDTATCRVKRRGEPEQARTFSMADAKAAGLSGKQGPWTQYPKRMRQMRARAFALRDVFPDVLRGLPVAEEVMDIPSERNMGAAEVVQPPAQPKFYDAAKFDANFPKWAETIRVGRKTADDYITFASTRGEPYTEEQQVRLRAVKKARDGQDATDAEPKKDATKADGDGVITMTYAQVAEKLYSARNADALAEAGSLISAVADEQQRQELAGLYEQLAAELA